MLLEIRNLKTYFYTYRGVVRAVDGVDLTLDKGETLGLAGESGCGKSVTALSILQLVPNPPGKIIDGQIFFNKENLLEKSEKEMRNIRGNKISMIFQEPMTSLDPVFTIGNEIMEAIQLHQGLNKGEAYRRTVEMLRKVKIPEPEKRMKYYPHQLSGGMRQRVMIAMALSCNPQLLIADEPTTALDVTIQAQILKLIKDLQDEYGVSVMLITHDLGVIAETCDNVAVMYCGNIVEYADVYSLFGYPFHPYTKGLIGSIPKMTEEVERLSVIGGIVPSCINPPSGCRFYPRCEYAVEHCAIEFPKLEQVEKGHFVRCWRWENID